MEMLKVRDLPACQCGCTVFFDGLWRHLVFGPDAYDYDDVTEFYSACPGTVSGYCVECGDKLPVRED